MKSKVLLGLLLGTILGAVDGACAGFYPEVRAIQGKLLFIIVGSTGKGLVAGLLTGFLARKLKNLVLGTLAGLLIAAAVTAPIAAQYDPDLKYVPFWEIMIPGSICGALVGFATQRYGLAATKDAAAAAKEPAR